MKSKILIIILLLSSAVIVSCKKDLLDQHDPNKLSSANFFTKANDAKQILMGVYLAGRECFYKSYAWDGASEMMHSRVNARPYSNYNPASNFGSSVSRHWNDAYRCINRANYLIVNIDKMLESGNFLPDEITELYRMRSEALFLRAITYFRLIDLWGDVPYYETVLNGNNDAYSLTRTAKASIKDKIIAALDTATLYIPITVAKADQGRVTRAAVYGYRGKIKLFWACWQKTAGNTSEAQKYYQEAANDFAEVMKPVYGRKLYMDGAPGSASAPYYIDMFDGQHEDAMYSSEVIFAFTNGGPSFGAADGQSDEFYGDTYLYDFGTRTTGAGGCNVTPTIRLLNRYQLITTGDFSPALIPLNLNTVSDARTRLNSAINPASYVGRDYRMKASIMWDGETIREVDGSGNVTSKTSTFLFKTNAPTPDFIFADGCATGYIFRKYIRQMTGNFAREAGPQDAWMMRLPDVWLMYAEAVNEISGPTAETFDLIDQIRHRGNLPPLDRAKFGSKNTFFDAIEQERIIELVAEGHRFFDIRRWHKVEEIWAQPDGQTLYSTWNEKIRDEFKNAIERDFQRFYLFQIPNAEIQNNSKITQNDPWL